MIVIFSGELFLHLIKAGNERCPLYTDDLGDGFIEEALMTDVTNLGVASSINWDRREKSSSSGEQTSPSQSQNLFFGQTDALAVCLLALTEDVIVADVVAVVFFRDLDPLVSGLDVDAERINLFLDMDFLVSTCVSLGSFNTIFHYYDSNGLHENIVITEFLQYNIS